MSEYDIYLSSLDELRLAKPFAIQDSLTDDTKILAGLDEQAD